MINSVGVVDHEVYTARMRQFIDDVCVYPVSCEKLAGGRNDLEWLDQVLLGGAKIVQLRDKVSKDRDFLQKAKYFREKTREAGVLFLVNDRLDIALLADADGIHVGQGDMPPEDIRRLAPNMIIGYSCNEREQIVELGNQVEAQNSSVSYYNVGPIYQTGTKEGLKRFLGPAIIEDYTTHCNLPFTVMGGIKESHIDDLIDNGAKRIAVVTAISEAVDIAGATRKLQQKICEKRNNVSGVRA